MRTLIRMLTVAGIMAAGGGLASAQDAASMAAMQASQQAVQISVQASQQAIDSMNQATQIAQANMQMAMSQANADMLVGRRPALPVTPRPVILKLKGGVSVALYDADPKAIVFYTIDGSTPTLRSLRYAGPIVVSSKMKVRALAFDLEDMPSGVVSKTVRAKS